MRLNKFCLVVCLVVFVCMFVYADMARAGATDKVDRNKEYGYQFMIIEWTANADGSFTTYDTEKSVVGYVVRIVTVPGTPAPSDNYDIVLSDSYGCDIAGGDLADRDTSVTEHVIPKMGNSYAPPLVDGPLKLAINGNSAGKAKGKVIVYVSP